MTTQELVERLNNWIEAEAAIEWPYPTLPHERISALIVAAHRLSEMDAENKRLREALQNTGAHNNPPCAICGYNGPNYYQPETHSCMAKARAVLEHQQKEE